MDLGLERVTRLLEALAPHSVSEGKCNTLEAAPHLAFPIIHVAGTNGKGSICAYLSSILHAAGLRVGRYNSPHLITPRDTIQINNQPISQIDYEWVTKVVQEKNLELNLKATSFEVLTATAFYWFAYGRSNNSNKSEDGNANERVDVAIIEVGVGGRLDATNIVPQPLVSVIASIGMDHGALLGNTIEQVAFEKAGIIKSGVPVVIAPQAEGDKVYKVLEKQAMDVGLSVDQVYKVQAAKWIQSNQVSPDLLSKLSLESNNGRHGQWAVTKDGLQILIPLLGDFQLENAATAIYAIYAMRANAFGYDRGIVDQMKKEKWEQAITEDAIQIGIRDTVWPGRLQWIESEAAPKQVGGRMLIDGAHNPAAAIALRSFIDGYINSIRSSERGGGGGGKGEEEDIVRIHWIMGFTKGKDIEEMFDILFPRNANGKDTFSAVEFSEPEGMPWISAIPSQEVCERLNSQQKRVYGNVEEEGRGGLTINGFGTDLKAGLEWVGRERSNNDIVVLCGSLYLAADLFRMME
ncbi:folylpolyglutamate synthase [Entomortierella beljakovae]|nr:folylpolyglutamate synthase [Entomortierella beljakovae]